MPISNGHELELEAISFVVSFKALYIRLNDKLGCYYYKDDFLVLDNFQAHVRPADFELGGSFNKSNVIIRMELQN